MVANWWKYLLLGAGAFVIGRFSGVHTACRNPEVCEIMERYYHYKHDQGMMADRNNPRPDEYAVDRGYREV